MNNVKYYINRADQLRLLAGRIKSGNMHPMHHDVTLLQECASLINRLAQVEDASISTMPRGGSMTSQSPAAKLEAKANRENTKLVKARDELHMVLAIIKHSDLPPEIKLRLYAAIRLEDGMITADQDRLNGLRKAAEISRSKQWIMSGDK